MSSEILISSDPWENRVAILENGSLAEIYIEREEKVIGSIYKGKVQNVLPGMGASFVDIGLGRNAFLYVDDINKTPLNIGDVEITQGRSGFTISEKVNRGDDVLIQIVKEPRGLKGARVSTNITLPGRYLILMPTGKFSGVSRKIESADERLRLKNVMKRIRPDGMATVVRTAAAGVSDAELIADLGVLIRMWHGILENFKSSPSPALIHKDMNLVFKAARDFITPHIDRVLVDNPAECEKIRDFMRLLSPQYVDRIKLYEKQGSLFRDYKVDEELARLMRPKVNLPSGGSLVVETTEALTVIDVNSGKFTGGKNLEETILHTNLEAAAEIARQVRLRDIGGMIVCDFIDMNQESSRNKVIAVLETGLRRDRTRSTIQSFSALGLLEFTRKRVGKDLWGQLRAACPTCRGIGNVLSPESVAIDAFRDVRMAAHSHGGGDMTVFMPPTVGAQTKYWHDEDVLALEAEIGSRLQVSIDPLLHPEQTRVMRTLLQVPQTPIRVGDELEVDVLPNRMPNAASATACYNGRLIEIENGVGAIGQTIGIKVIDVDGDDVLAELRTPAPSQFADQKRRRRRGGRGRALTPIEQNEELLELAEEAARSITARPVASPDPVAPAATVSAVSVPAEALGQAPKRIGERVGELESDEATQKRRRRRRRRRGRGGAEGALPGAVGLDAVGGISPVEDAEEAEDAELEPETDTEAAALSPALDSADDRPRRRRRRRRGRGNGGGDQQQGNGLMPDRTIFRVNPEGVTEPTGRQAPPEPVRALTPWRQGGQVAVDPTPPSLSLPEETPLVTRPARRRMPTTPPAVVSPAAPRELASTTRRALPPPAVPNATTSAPAASVPSAAASAEADAPKPAARRGRPRKVDSQTASSASASGAQVALPMPVAAPTPAAETPRRRSATRTTPPAEPTPIAEAPPVRRGPGRPPSVRKPEPEPEAEAPVKRTRAKAAPPVEEEPAPRATRSRTAAAAAKATTATRRRKTS